MFSIERTLRNIAIGGVFMLPFLVLIVSTNLFFPYITGKNFAFRAIVEVIFAAAVALVFINGQYRKYLTPLLGAVSLFVAVALLTALLGENPYKSFWGNYERMEGVITLIHLLAYLFAVHVVMTTQHMWLWFWRVSLGVSALVTTHAFFQYLLAESVTERFFSTLGNPIYLAVYALFHIFIALTLAVREEVSGHERVLTLLPLPLLFFSLYLTSTRGATLGIIAGLFVACAGIAYTHRASAVVRKWALVALITVSVLIVAFYAVRESSFVQDNQLLKRYASITLTDKSISARAMVWGMALEGIKEKPLLGWGHESFNYVFNAYYNPNMYNLEPWYDRTHNVVLDWLIASGIVGFLAYMSMLGVFVYTLRRSTHFTSMQKWLLFGLITAYILQNLTVFDQVVSYFFFFSCMGWVILNERRDDTKPRVEPNKQVYVALGAGVFALILIWSVNHAAYAASKTLLQALQYEAQAMHLYQTGKTPEALEALAASRNTFVRAYAYNSFGGQEISEQIAQTTARVSAQEWVPDAEKEAWYTVAIDELSSELSRAPNDARLTFFKATVHGSVGNFDLEKEALEKTNELTPQKPMVLAMLANNALRRGAYDEALMYGEGMLELAPRYLQGSEILAVTYIHLNDYEAFDGIVESEPVLGSRASVLGTLLNKHQDERARTVHARTVHDESPAEEAYALAVLYYSMGDIESAVREASRVMAAVPRLKDVGADLIRQIQQ